MEKIPGDVETGLVGEVAVREVGAARVERRPLQSATDRNEKQCAAEQEWRRGADESTARGLGDVAIDESRVRPGADDDERHEQEGEERYRRRFGARYGLARCAQIREQRRVDARAPLGEDLDVDGGEERGNENREPAVDSEDRPERARGEERRPREENRGNDQEVGGGRQIHARAVHEDAREKHGAERQGLGSVVREEDEAEESEEEEPERRVAEEELELGERLAV